MSDKQGTLQELLVASFNYQTDNLYTAIPCIVIAVREAGDTALVDIQPTVNQRLVDGTVSERAPVLGVPVSFPISSDAGVIFPIKVGTTGTAIFSMRSIESWKAGNGRPRSPTVQSKFDKSDAIFFPGIQPPGVTIASPTKHVWPHSNGDVVVFNNVGSGTENEVRLKASGEVVINTNQNVSVNCNNASITAQGEVAIDCSNFDLTADTATFAIGNTTWQGTFTGNGASFTFNGLEYNTHYHTNVSPGSGNSGGPVS